MLLEFLKKIGTKKSGFEKIDLHIHTPASHRCYQGAKNGSEYLKILQRAKERKIKVIAITDHNSIAGYKRILELKNDLLKKKVECLKKKVSEEAQKELRTINKHLDCYSYLLILPGIEFETMDNVHMLVIFNPETPIEDIEKFLKSGGYDKGNMGYDKPPFPAKWNILGLFDNAAKYDSIIIDAHTDSDKGIYNTIRKGSYRANCFKSDHLHAVCYKNEKQKDELENTLKISPDYKRNIPLAFIKSSDAHTANDVGRPCTWFRLEPTKEKIEFEDIKRAISNPVECISVEAPQISKILNSLIKDDNSFGIPAFSKEDKEYFKKLVCALNNTEGGNCLFGLNKNKNKVGLKFSETNKKIQKNLLKKYLREILNCLNSIDGDCQVRFQFYPLQNDKLIISVRVEKTDNLMSIKEDDRIYIIKRNKLKALSAKEIQRLIEEKQTKFIENKIESTVEKIKNECSLVLNTFRSFPILKSFEDKSILLRRVVSTPKIVRSTTLNELDIRKLKDVSTTNPNGRSKGTIIFIDNITPPRLKEAYLRYSIPKFNLKLTDRPIKKEIIYIVLGGAVYYSKSEYPIYLENLPLVITVSSKKPNQYSNKFITCFLKSTFWLWYTQSKFEDLDWCKLDIFESVRIPKINLNIGQTKDIVLAIENNLDKILITEKNYLSRRYKKNEYAKATVSHNKKIDMLAYEIDQKIYELLELPSEQINIIEGFLNANNIHLPNKVVELINISK